MRHVSATVWRLAAGTLIVAVFAACSTSPSTSPSTSSPVLTQADANAVAEVVATDAAALPSGAEFDGSAGMPFAPAPMLGAPTLAATPGICVPTRSPNPPVDTDKDGVPDSVRIDFAGCTFTIGTYTATLSGTIDIVDPTPTVPDWAFRTRYTNFTRSVSNAATGETRSATENGMRSVVRTTAQLQLLDTMQTDYTYASGAKATHVRKWAATFTPDPAQSIQMGMRLPSGTWVVSGSSAFTSGTKNFSFSVQTTVPLHYNASCMIEPRFDKGTITAVITRGATTTTITIQFTACGQYTVTRS